MGVNYKRIFENCVSILDSYVPSYSIEYNFEEFIQNNKIENERILFEVLNGCYTHSIALNVFMNNYYTKNGKNSLKADENIFKEEFDLDYVENFVKYIDISKIIKFLRFATNRDYVITCIKEDWNIYYDTSYVDANLLNPFLKTLPALEKILNQLEEEINGIKPHKINATTQPQPFNLTLPKPIKIKLPSKITSEVKFGILPQSTYQTPEEFKKLEEVSTINKKRQLELLSIANQNQPKCAMKSKEALPDTQITNIKQFEAKSVSKNTLRGEMPVKLNTATVLREGNLYKKKTDAVINKFQNLEKGDGDASKFFKWQEEMKQIDKEKQLIEIEKKKLESKLVYEQAILAKNRLAEANKVKADNTKKEQKEIINNLKIQKQIEDFEQKHIVDRVRKDHKNAKIEQMKLKMEKKKIVDEMIQISEENELTAVKQIEEDMKKKMELIQKIKALESMPLAKKNFVDLSETAGHNILSEMSIVELKERLQIMRDKQIHQTGIKHDDIIAEKITKDKTIVETLQFINKYKNEFKKNAEKKEQQESNTNYFNDDIKKLNDKINGLKEERGRMKENERVSNKTLENSHQALHLLYINQRKQLESSRFSDLEVTQERFAKSEMII